MDFMFVIVLLIPFNCTSRIDSVDILILLPLAVQPWMRLDLLTRYSRDK